MIASGTLKTRMIHIRNCNDQDDNLRIILMIMEF
jgi:hypothetical protein